MSSFSQPEVPSAEGNGWKVGISGLLEIEWYDNFIPNELLDILSDKCQNKDTDDDEEEGEDLEDDDNELDH